MLVIVRKPGQHVKVTHRSGDVLRIWVVRPDGLRSFALDLRIEADPGVFECRLVDRTFDQTPADLPSWLVTHRSGETFRVLPRRVSVNPDRGVNLGLEDKDLRFLFQRYPFVPRRLGPDRAVAIPDGVVDAQFPPLPLPTIPPFDPYRPLVSHPPMIGPTGEEYAPPLVAAPYPWIG